MQTILGRFRSAEDRNAGIGVTRAGRDTETKCSSAESRNEPAAMHYAPTMGNCLAPEHPCIMASYQLRSPPAHGLASNPMRERWIYKRAASEARRGGLALRLCMERNWRRTTREPRACSGQDEP